MTQTQTPLIIEPTSKYDSLRATHLTNHGLMDYVRCPKTHKLRTSGLMPFKRSKAFEIGTAVHTLVLEGVAAYDAAYYIVNPEHEPVNEKTGKPYGVATKVYTEWLDSVKGDRTVLSESDGELVASMAHSVRNHDHACALLEQGTPEGVLRATVGGVKVQTRMDWFNPDMGIIDLKTIGDLDDFTEHFDGYNYDLQFAFYQLVAQEVMGAAFPVHAIVVEKKAPYRTGVFEVDPARLITERFKIAGLIEEYAKSVAADHWPTRYETVRTIGGES